MEKENKIFIVNNLKSPLKLSWSQADWQYKVNKPLDQSGEYVDKRIVDRLLNAILVIQELSERYGEPSEEEFERADKELNLAIEQAKG